MQESALPRLTLAQVVLPRQGVLQEALSILAFSALVAVCARIAIYLPFTDVPITGQTLGVLLTGAVLGSRRGALALVAYIGEGLAGVPVFAAGNTAWSPTRFDVPYIIGPTAGFLPAFVLAAFIVGWLAERGWDRTFWRSAAAMLAGNILLYVPGLSWYAGFVGAERALTVGLLPYIPGDTIKLLLAAAVLPSAWKLVNKQRGDSR